MYEWLDEALRDSAQVITANRRLARVLKRQYAERQAAAGKLAWESPQICDWKDWAGQLMQAGCIPAEIPIVISQSQSKLIWERCLRREINDPLLNIGQLAKMSRDTWNRLREWRVPFADVERSVRNRDQRLFATAATYYQSILDREGWIDGLGVVETAIQRLRAGSSEPLPAVTLAGFDRMSPLLQELVDLYIAAGGSTKAAAGDTAAANGPARILRYDNADSELRAAGSWARQQLLQDPDKRLGIVVSQLEQDAERSLRLVKEGLIPGWQCGSRKDNAVVNVSYGCKLTDYPAISAALLLLRWLHSDISTTEVGVLLRSSVFGAAFYGSRIRAELRLRQFPEQQWSVDGLLRFVRYEQGDDALQFISMVERQRAELPGRQTPGEWVTLFSQLLDDCNWPGSDPLGSAEFQTINRWRELLNEFARLELVVASMTAAEALARIVSMAGETIFQPESKAASVEVLGPLEAAGLEFDALWIGGASSANWPPPSRPLSLIARELQREFELPDASPMNTLQYAERVIDRLAASATEVVFSYPESLNDAQLSASELLQQIAEPSQCIAGEQDPGWHAAELVDRAAVTPSGPDRVPALARNEVLSGGASSIQRQFVEPFSAFVAGRLGVRGLWAIQPGLPANVRGSLIHAALQHLYAECPSQSDIGQWGDAETEQRVGKAVALAFRSVITHADVTLAQILRLEKTRVAALLHAVVETDLLREAFSIVAVEQGIEARVANLAMRLRIDRIDLDAQQQNILIDYKTGAVKRLLSRDKQPLDIQLVVYAAATAGPTSGIALFNIDSRNVSLDVAGKDVSASLDWDAALPEWIALIERAAAEIAAGDVRIDRLQSIQQSRPFSLLSRVRELQVEQ